MLKTLIQKQLLELFQSYFIDRKTGKARSKTGTAVFFILFALLFIGLGFVFFAMANGLGGAILGGGVNWLYFALMGLISIALGVFGSVFNTYAGVYLPKDNELLMSMPIPNRTLLLARLSGVYVTSLMYSAWIWIPIVIAYWLLVPVNALNIAFPILLTFVIALFVSVLSCALGWVVALIASKAKGKSFITLFLSLAVFALYYFVYFKIVGSLGEIISHIDELGETVKSWLRYAHLIGKAADGDPVSMLCVLLITLALAAACVFVLSRTFTKLSTAGTSAAKKRKAPAEYPQRPFRTALIRREYRHFTSVSTWMLNGGFGLLLMPIAAVALVVKSGTIREFLPRIAMETPGFFALLPAIVLLAVCFVLSINAILPVSVSMEGKTLWQLQSLPLEPWEILRAKESMCVRLCAVPMLFFVLVTSAVLGFSWWDAVLICVAAVMYLGLISDFGLFLNLKMPNLSWTNVASLTKQSAPVVVSMFGGWAFCAALGVGGFFLAGIADIRVILAGCGLLFALMWLALRGWLKTKGAKILETL